MSEHPAASIPLPSAASSPARSWNEQDLAAIASGTRIIALRELGDPDAAADVAQETVLRTMQALRAGQLRDPARLGAFARSIAYHVIGDHRRALARRTSLSEDFGSHDHGDSLDSLVSSEDVARMHRAIAALSALDRDILRLMFVEGLSATEVAVRLGASSERMRKRKSRALERLRERFFGGKTGHESPAGATLYENDSRRRSRFATEND